MFSLSLATSTTISRPTRESLPPLSMRGVVKRWRGQRTAVLDGVSLDVTPGTVTWVGGRNGAGKTTLLRIAAGLIMADEGTCTLRGLDPERDRRKYQTNLGFLSGGNAGLYARLSVRAHLEMWSRLAFVPRQSHRALVDRALARFELVELADRRVDRMSMGQRQRLRVAMTFLHEPVLVLLDEPRNSLDLDGLALLVRALEDLRVRGGAAIWCSPIGEELGTEPDVRLVVEDGKLVPA